VTTHKEKIKEIIHNPREYRVLNYLYTDLKKHAIQESEKRKEKQKQLQREKNLNKHQEW